MATTNEITGDKIISGKENREKFEKNYSKIKPQCFDNCKELQGTMAKCRLCDWKVQQEQT